MARVEQRFTALGTLARGVGEAMGVALGGGSLAHFINDAVTSGDEMAKAAEKAGTGVEAFSALAFAAKGAGVDLDSLSGAFKKMQTSVSGGGEIFAKIGVDLAKLKSQSPEQQFQTLAAAIAAIKDPADRTAAAVAIFGRSGQNLLPLFNEGAEGIAKAMQAAKDFGATLSEDVKLKLEQTSAAMKALGATTGGFWQKIAADISPATIGIADWVRQMLGGASATEKLKNEIQSMRSAQGDAAQNGNMAEVARYQAAIDEATSKIAGLAHPAVDSTALVAAANQAKALDDELARIDSHFKTMATFKANSAWLEEYNKEATHLEETIYRLGQANKQTLQQFDSDTQTDIEKILAKWKEFDTELLALEESGAISPEEGAKRAKAYQDSVLPPITIGSHQLKIDTITDASEATKAMEQLFKQCGQGIQADFAGALEGADHSFSEFSASILKTMEHLFAQTAVMKLFNLLGTIGLPNWAGGTGSGSLSQSSTDSIFGGNMAGGGPLEPGHWYVAGENGPEPIWGGGAGAYAAGYGNGNGSSPVNVTMQVDARGATVDAIQLLPGAMKQAADMAVQRVQQMKRQGTL